MERIVQRCVGLDVHKASVTACVRVATTTSEGEEPHQETRKFSTTTGGLLELRDWLALQEERADHATLEAYLDQMGTLLLDRDLHTSEENSDVRRLARARTLVVLDALGPTRQERVLRFLGEVGPTATPQKRSRTPKRPSKSAESSPSFLPRGSP